jgi:predicted dienelactone hydrolase
MSIGVVAFVVSVAAPVVVPVFRFPRPGGPYAIGTVTFHWRDADRREIFSADPAARRELMAQVWYPAERGIKAPTAPYVADATALSSAAGRLLHVPGSVFDYWDMVPTHATRMPPMASTRSEYPVLVFASGLSGFRQSNMFQVEQLVSRGFVVVDLDQPYTSAATVFPDGRTVAGWTKNRLGAVIEQSITPITPAPMLGDVELPNGVIPYLAQDVSSALDQLARLNAADPRGLFTHRLDLDQIGAFGISLGSMAVGEACHADPRLRACLMMDAAMPADVVRDGLKQPGM